MILYFIVAGMLTRNYFNKAKKEGKTPHCVAGALQFMKKGCALLDLRKASLLDKRKASLFISRESFGLL